jgi:hypothetical protein
MRTWFGSIKSLLGLAVPAVVGTACALTLSINPSSPATLVVPVTQIVNVTQVVPVTQVVLVTQVEPVTEGTTPQAGNRLQIFAAQGWQETGLQVRSGQQFWVDSVWGQIADGDSHVDGGAGVKYVCGHAGCCEPLPDAPRDALVGRIGTEVFLIGNGGILTSPANGSLQLRINDCDSGTYDNSGALHVSVTIPER